MLALAPLSARLPVQDSLLKINLVDQFVYFYNLVRGWKGEGGGGAAVTMNTMKMFCKTR